MLCSHPASQVFIANGYPRATHPVPPPPAGASFRAPAWEQRLLPTAASLLLQQLLTKPLPPSLLCTDTLNYLFSGGFINAASPVTLSTQEPKKLQKAAALRPGSRLCHCHRAQLTARSILKRQLLLLYFRSPKTCFMSSCHKPAKSVKVQGDCSEGEAPGSLLPPAPPGKQHTPTEAVGTYLCCQEGVRACPAEAVESTVSWDIVFHPTSEPCLYTTCLQR